MLVQFVNYELKVFIRLTTEIPLKSLHTFVVIFCLEWLVNVHPDPMNNGQQLSLLCSFQATFNWKKL